jgi:GTP-binding protein
VKVLNADFVTSAARADGIPRDELPQVAFVGRSNVGKSSLINALARARIARTSAAPGKTRLVNFYRLLLEGGPGGPGRWGLYLVDLPGYGYARRSRASRRPEHVEGRGGSDSASELARVSESYVGERRANGGPTGTLLLVDSRHPGLPADRGAAEWLTGLGAKFSVVATKIDKLTRGERVRNLRLLEATFGMTALPVSAESGEGMDELWRTIARLARNAA